MWKISRMEAYVYNHAPIAMSPRRGGGGGGGLNPAAKIIGAIGIVVVVVCLLALTPTVVDQVQNMNTTGWTFTGYQGAIALLGLVPFIWVASILVAAAVGMFALARS